MADYSLSGTHSKLNQLCDKIGSDYFAMPVFLNFFEMSTFDFISKRVKEVEKTQSITDDIRGLVVKKDLDVIPSSDDEYKYICGLPIDYYHLFAHHVFYKNNTDCRVSNLVKHAEYAIAKLNPNERPSRYYPLILQHGSLFEIDAGDSATPVVLRITYCKKPNFSSINSVGNRVVNLPDDVIDNILKKTVVELFNKTGDQRYASSDQLEKEFQKIYN